MSVEWTVDPELTPALRDEIVTLWHVVSEAGGAVGFVPPVTREEVRPIAEAAFAGVESGPDRLLIGRDGGRVVGLVFLTGVTFPLKQHWRTLKRVMIDPAVQGRGLGMQLLAAAERVAREAGWDALHLTVRGGTGTEGFYQRCGYKEVGRLPGAIRVAPGDDRDEILMWLPLR